MKVLRQYGDNEESHNKYIDKSFQSLSLLDDNEVKDIWNGAVKYHHDKIEKLELAYSELEKELSIEKLKNTELNESDIMFFLNKLKSGDINDIKYRRTLINIFVKSVYLYEDKVTIIFNIDNMSVTINSIILNKIDKKSKKLYSTTGGVPIKDTI